MKITISPGPLSPETAKRIARNVSVASSKRFKLTVCGCWNSEFLKNLTGRNLLGGTSTVSQKRISSGHLTLWL